MLGGFQRRVRGLEDAGVTVVVRGVSFILQGQLEACGKQSPYFQGQAVL